MAKINNFNVGNLYKLVTTTTPSGSVNSTSNTLINSILIPANTFSINDIVTLETCVTKSGAVYNGSVFFYYNTSSSLIGATLLATFSNFGTNTRAAQLYRRLSIVTSDGSGNGTQVVSSSYVARDDMGSYNYTGGFSTLSINWTSDVYLIVSGLVANSAENLTCQWLKAANG
jgi:hypothetical protein